jgi:hypothetical protein
MNSDQENFEQLRRLLALKRYELPPPRYFNDFSSQVIARIRAGERGESSSALESLFADTSWLQRLWGALESRPAFAGAFGATMCGLLLAGIVYSSNVDVGISEVGPMVGDYSTPFTTANVPLPAASSLSSESGILPSSVAMPGPKSLFDQFQAQNPFQQQVYDVNYVLPQR